MIGFLKSHIKIGIISLLRHINSNTKKCFEICIFQLFGYISCEIIKRMGLLAKKFEQKILFSDRVTKKKIEFLPLDNDREIPFCLSKTNISRM